MTTRARTRALLTWGWDTRDTVTVDLGDSPEARDAAEDYWGDPSEADLDGLDGLDGLDQLLPVFCPECGGVLQDDPPDYDVGLMSGALYCETDGCPWPGQAY